MCAIAFSWPGGGRLTTQLDESESERVSSAHVWDPAGYKH